MDVLHHDEIDIALRLELVNGDDVRMIERGEGFASRRKRWRRCSSPSAISGENLDRDLARQTCVARQIDLTHTASPQSRRSPSYAPSLGGRRHPRGNSNTRIPSGESGSDNLGTGSSCARVPLLGWG